MPTWDWKEPLRRLVATVLRVRARLSRRRVGVVLVYHGVDQRHGDRSRELVPPHGLALFEAQLHHVRRCYRIVRAAELEPVANARRWGRRIPLAITFDDDLRSHAEFAAPVLGRLDLPATFFLTGAALEGPAEFWWEQLQRVADRGAGEAGIDRLFELAGGEPPAVAGRSRMVALGRAIERLTPARRDAVADALTALAGSPARDVGLRAAEVRALAAAGHDVGFHTRRHYRLTTLDDGRLAAAMVDGREAVARAAGRELDLLAYPHGRADARVAAAARAAGFARAFTTVPGAVAPGGDRWLIPRVEPSFRTPGHFALQLAQIVSGAAAPPAVDHPSRLATLDEADCRL